MTAGDRGWSVSVLRQDPQRWRWVGWVALATAFALFSFHRVSTSVISDQLMRTFETTGASLGTLHASLFYIYAIMQVPAGILVDRIGARRLASGGTLVMGVGVMMFALASSYLVAFLGRAVIGLGGSVLYISTLRYCANWYRSDEFATMTGVTSAMAGIGGMVATTPLAVAVATLGWRQTLVGIGLFGIIVGIQVYAIVRDTPTDGGFSPIAGAAPPGEPSLRAVVANARRVLRDPATWLLGVVFLAFIATTFTVLGLWGIPFIVDRYGVSVEHASTYLFLGNLGFLLGPPVMGRLSDRFELRAPVITGASVIFMAGYGTIALHGRPPLVLVGVIFFVTTFVGGAGFITFTSIKNRHPSAASGSATGAVNSLGFVGVAVLPTVMGWLLDRYWTGELIDGARVYTSLGYRAAFAVAALMGFVAFLGSFWYWYAPPSRPRSTD